MKFGLIALLSASICNGLPMQATPKPAWSRKHGVHRLVTSSEITPRQAPPLIGVLEGAGIGGEVVDSALQVLKAAGQVLNLKFEIRHGGLIGEDAIAAHGKWLPEDTVDFCADIFHRGGAILNGPGGE